MKNIRLRILANCSVILLVLITPACKREWVNPLDEESGIEWAPLSIGASALSSDSVVLSWYCPYSFVDSFILDKKINDGNWIEKYSSVSGQNSHFIDDSIDTKHNVYSYRVYAHFGDKVSESVSVKYSFACGFDSLIDVRDGNKYATIQVGYQCWMKENLKYLPEIFPPDSLSVNENRYYVYGYAGNQISEAVNAENYQAYGVLYNWPAASNACPEGWQIPDWEYLISKSGGFCCAGRELKEKDTVHWNSPNIGATDKFGFKALPGGYVDDSSGFANLRNAACFWGRSGQFYSNQSYSMFYDKISVDELNASKYFGLSVRCVKE
jgi:uncharacterized protein (TIGR02145 family)